MSLKNLPKEDIKNFVTEIYDTFTDDDISRQIVRMIADKDIGCEVEIIFQSVEGLHKSCPDTPGDWYFSGDYPTPGGNRMVNKAFINWYEGNPLKR